MDAQQIINGISEFQALCLRRFPELNDLTDEQLADLANFVTMVYLGRKDKKASKGFRSLTP